MDCSKKTRVTGVTIGAIAPLMAARSASERYMTYLKRSSNAFRALFGAGPEDPVFRGACECVSRSTVTRGENSSHEFRASFGDTRAVIGWAHSKRRPASNDSHCAHE